uniref:PAN2-PAN3 deadenylation complex subunit PAN3 n=1 Tax=Onchocerca volvulus TaxID=6282 RepID=A0A8R1U201_ONCVO
MQSGSGSSTGSDLFSNYEQHPPPPGSRLAQYLHGNSTQQVPRPSGWASRLPPNQSTIAGPYAFNSNPASHSSNLPHFTSSFAAMGLSDEKDNPSLSAMPYGFPSSSQRSLNYSNVTQGLTASPIMHDPMRPSSHISQENCGSTTANYMQENFGGTTYFFTPTTTNSAVADGQSSIPQKDDRVYVTTNGNFIYHGPLPHIGKYKPPRGLSYFTPPELKMELLQRQLAIQCRAEPSLYPDIPQNVEYFQNLVPLENVKFVGGHMERGIIGSHITTVYKAINGRDGMPYCLRRIHNFRVNTMKQLSLADNWKKLMHVNIVQLRDVIQTRQFGDHSLIFAYDYHPLSETLKNRHLNNRLNGSSKLGPIANLSGGGPVVQESLMWSYIVQLSSALRAIHSAGMAARTVDPSKIIVFDKTKQVFLTSDIFIVLKVMLSSCGILDVINPGNDHTIQLYQQDDLNGLGRVLIALAMGSLHAIRRENISNSISIISQQCTTDLKNIITLLLQASTQRPHSINEVMPMIGARFYAQLETTQMKNDLLENELSKELENGRLFRLLCKLNTITERAEFQMDMSWSETGDRYLLKLFRDYLFHQITETGKPWIDMAHIVTSLNKLDAGVNEKIQLVSRDGENVLVVSYTDLRRCLENAFTELQNRLPSIPNPLLPVVGHP